MIKSNIEKTYFSSGDMLFKATAYNLAEQDFYVILKHGNSDVALKFDDFDSACKFAESVVTLAEDLSRS